MLPHVKLVPAVYLLGLSAFQACNVICMFCFQVVALRFTHEPVFAISDLEGWFCFLGTRPFLQFLLWRSGSGFKRCARFLQ